MKYDLLLNNGQTLSLSGDSINTEELTNTLNNMQIQFVNFGGAILSKQMIAGLIPEQEEKSDK